MKPYSEDLRKAAMKAYNDGLGSYEKVAKIFNVHPKSLQNWVKMDKAGLDQKARGKGHRSPALSQADRENIERCIELNPSITLEELRKLIGVNTQLSVYWRVARELGFTYKKKDSQQRNTNAMIYHVKGKLGKPGKKLVLMKR